MRKIKINLEVELDIPDGIIFKEEEDIEKDIFPHFVHKDFPDSQFEPWVEFQNHGEEIPKDKLDEIAESFFFNITL